MDEWILASGAPKHNGYQRHEGALMNWRRVVRLYRKKRLRIGLVVRPPGLMSELNRRVFPTEWLQPLPDEYYSYHLRQPHRVLGRGKPFGPGPVGFRRN